MKKKKIIAGILVASGLILGVKGVRDITFKSNVNMSTQWIFGSPSEGQLSFARNGQVYQEKINSKGTIETVIAGVLFTTGIVFIK
jgi:hypothetical protein